MLSANFPVPKGTSQTRQGKDYWNCKSSRNQGNGLSLQKKSLTNLSNRVLPLTSEKKNCLLIFPMPSQFSRPAKIRQNAHIWPINHRTLTSQDSRTATVEKDGTMIEMVALPSSTKSKVRAHVRRMSVKLSSASESAWSYPDGGSRAQLQVTKLRPWPNRSRWRKCEVPNWRVDREIVDWSVDGHIKKVGTSLCRDFFASEIFFPPATGECLEGGSLDLLEIVLFILDDSGSSSRSSKSDWTRDLYAFAGLGRPCAGFTFGFDVDMICILDCRWARGVVSSCVWLFRGVSFVLLGGGSTTGLVSRSRSSSSEPEAVSSSSSMHETSGALDVAVTLPILLTRARPVRKVGACPKPAAALVEDLGAWTPAKDRVFRGLVIRSWRCVPAHLSSSSASSFSSTPPCPICASPAFCRPLSASVSLFRSTSFGSGVRPSVGLSISPIPAALSAFTCFLRRRYSAWCRCWVNACATA